MRTAGILMPVFSLPSPYGIGTFGKSAFEFIDFLKQAHQSYWQILPLNPTSFGDSPYQSFSSFAGNPYFIDLDLLVCDGLLSKGEILEFNFGDDCQVIDYEALYNNRYALLKKAFDRFVPDKDYDGFILQNAAWLNDYALFMALKQAFGGAPWYEWSASLQGRKQEAVDSAKKEYINEINFYKFLQYKFYAQWQALKKYANENNVKIIGDIPIYVALDSADVWANPEQFQLDAGHKPLAVAGVPPDAFSADGQLWGNPLYNWDYMKKTDYAWWKNYLSHALKTYDTVRIDHFRGFESYFSIPYGDQNAKNGRWVKGPDYDLFKALKAELGENLPIIAEDLGVITPAVRKMLDKTAFPGMKVLQFAFDGKGDNAYLPHNHVKNCVVYTGTHDNDTILGWAKENADSLKQAKAYFNTDGNSFNWAMIKAAYASVADTCIIPMADFLGLDSCGRINIPSTLGNNWCWRIKGECLNSWLANIIKENVMLYNRTPLIK